MKTIFKHKTNLLNNFILNLFSLENISNEKLPFIYKYYNYDAYLLNGYG